MARGSWRSSRLYSCSGAAADGEAGPSANTAGRGRAGMFIGRRIRIFVIGLFKQKTPFFRVSVPIYAGTGDGVQTEKAAGNAGGFCNAITLYSSSNSAIHAVLKASDGILHAPRGERLSGPTIGPSGMQERLYCCVRKRR